VYLKYVSVSQQLIAPIFSDLYPSTNKGHSRWGAISCHQKYLTNYLLLLCRLGRAPWQTRMASGWRGYVWALKKIGAFRDSAHKGLQSPTGIRMKKCLVVYTNTQHTNIFLCMLQKNTFQFLSRHNKLRKTKDLITSI
jgi:hypothetical protein